MNYIPDWLCNRCSQPFSKHVRVGTPNEDDGGQTPATDNWCFSFATELGRSTDNKEHNWKFTPVDNLTQVEQLAKQKNLI